MDHSACLTTAVNFLLPKYVQLILRDVFLCACVNAEVGL
jgi:hypothetical protein